jgi:hypothetical protein
MSEKLTPWFPAKVKPARAGVYQTSNTDSADGKHFYSYFDGKNWHGEWWTPERAMTQPAVFNTPVEQLRATRWRGLAKEPK